MSIFDLHSDVLADYRDFVHSFFRIAGERAGQFVEHALVDEARLWPDFLLQVSPAYARAATVDELAERGRVPQGCGQCFGTSREPSE
jgi:hypothetical protein